MDLVIRASPALLAELPRVYLASQGGHDLYSNYQRSMSSPSSVTLLPTHSGVIADLCYHWEPSSVTRLPLTHLFLGTGKSHEVFRNYNQILMKVLLGKLYDKTQ